MTTAGDWIAVVVELAIFLPLYFAPSIVATMRKHRNALAIFMLNLLLGWTGLCWIAALIWGCTNNVQAESTLN